jgi:catechol 2,3-dioxygenase-like lactoylglutathione lyase family enzyme
MSAAPAFADVLCGRLRLLLSGPASSGARATPGDASAPGCNRIHLVVDDLDAEIARLRAAAVPFRSDLVAGPGGRQILVADPDGNLVELFQPAERPRSTETAPSAREVGRTTGTA